MCCLYSGFGLVTIGVFLMRSMLNGRSAVASGRRVGVRGRNRKRAHLRPVYGRLMGKNGGTAAGSRRWKCVACMLGPPRP